MQNTVHAHNAAVGARILEGNGRKGQIALAHASHKVCQNRSLDQGNVAVDDKHALNTRCLQIRQGAGQGVPCAELFLLQHKVRVGSKGKHALLHFFCSMSCHKPDIAGKLFFQRMQDIAHHGFA